MKHTKGTWSQDGIDIYADDNGHIAQCYDAKISHISNMDIEIAEANAKLITQAPNMLQECIKAFDLVSKLQIPTDQELHEVSNSLREVIEKATK